MRNQSIFPRPLYLLLFVTLFASPVFTLADDQAEQPSESESLTSKASSLWKKTKESTIKGAEIVAEKTADTWDATKETTKDGVDKTKETSQKVWKKTKETSSDVADATTDAAESGWSATKSATKKVLNFGAGALKKAGDAISDDEAEESASEPVVVDKTE